jgi:hypothetical protein
MIALILSVVAIGSANSQTIYYKVFNFSYNINSANAIQRMADEGYRPATYLELKVVVNSDVYLGYIDGLFHPVVALGTFVSDDNIRGIVGYVKAATYYYQDIPNKYSFEWYPTTYFLGVLN